MTEQWNVTRVEVVGAAAAVAVTAATAWMLSPLSPVGSVVEAAGSGGALAAGLMAAAYLWLAVASISLTAIDLASHRLPNAIVLPGYPVVVVGLGGAALLAGDGQRAGIAAAAAGILFAGYAVLAAASPGGLGMGDVKLAGVLGAYLGFSGWGAVAVGVFGAVLLGGLVSLVLLATRRVTRSSGIPFGPWMLAGAWLALVAGEPLAAGYLSAFDLS